MAENSSCALFMVLYSGIYQQRTLFKSNEYY